jgi:hypothetical protein
MKVDLPTPGTPEIPTRIALPVCGSSAFEHLARALLVVGPLRLDQVMVLASGAQLMRQHAIDQRLVGGIERCGNIGRHVGFIGGVRSTVCRPS